MVPQKPNGLFHLQSGIKMAPCKDFQMTTFAVLTESSVATAQYLIHFAPLNPAYGDTNCLYFSGNFNAFSVCKETDYKATRFCNLC